MISGTLQLLPTPCNKKIKSSDFSVQYKINENHVGLIYKMDRPLCQLFQNEKAFSHHGSQLLTRQDKLWERNCLEFFLKPDSGSLSYLEFNFSLDGKWNVFHFDDYRLGKKETKNLTLETMDFDLSSDMSTDTLLTKFSLNSPITLNCPRFHGSAIIYIDQNPCYFHNLPETQQPPDFHYFHNY